MEVSTNSQQLRHLLYIRETWRSPLTASSFAIYEGAMEVSIISQQLYQLFNIRETGLSPPTASIFKLLYIRETWRSLLTASSFVSCYISGRHGGLHYQPSQQLRELLYIREAIAISFASCYISWRQEDQGDMEVSTNSQQLYQPPHIRETWRSPPIASSFTSCYISGRHGGLHQQPAAWSAAIYQGDMEVSWAVRSWWGASR
jgi:hypothetical protein